MLKPEIVLIEVSHCIILGVFSLITISKAGKLNRKVYPKNEIILVTIGIETFFREPEKQRMILKKKNLREGEKMPAGVIKIRLFSV